MLKWGVIQNTFLEKGQFMSKMFLVGTWGKQTCGKLKKSECIHQLSLLQNSRVASAKGHAKKERLHV